MENGKKGHWVPDGRNPDTGKQYYKWRQEQAGTSTPPDNFDPGDLPPRRNGSNPGRLPPRSNKGFWGNYNADLSDPDPD